MGDQGGTLGWRVGRKVGRTLYIGDQLVGVMDTPELARQVVAAITAAAPPPTDVLGENVVDVLAALHARPASVRVNREALARVERVLAHSERGDLAWALDQVYHGDDEDREYHFDADLRAALAPLLGAS